jgi:hypothetical protein
MLIPHPGAASGTPPERQTSERQRRSVLRDRALAGHFPTGDGPSDSWRCAERTFAPNQPLLAALPGRTRRQWCSRVDGFPRRR